MTFGHSTRLFIEHGPAAQTAQVEAGRSTARTWRILDPDRRLAIVDRALGAANDDGCALPTAL